MTLRQILGRQCQDRNTERKKREGKGGEREEVDRRRKGERREDIESAGAKRRR